MTKPTSNPGQGHNNSHTQSVNNGGGGNNAIVGTDFGETIIGTDGDDVIFGGGGNDIIIGEGGNDVMDGQDGSDTYIVSLADGFDTIQDTGTGVGDYDTLLAGSDYTQFYFTDGFSDANGIEEIGSDGYFAVKIWGSSGDDTLDFSNTVLTDISAIVGAYGNDTILGSAGDDSIYGMAGDDILVGNGGNDVLVGANGADMMTGGDGSDTFVYLRLQDAGDVITDFQTGQGGDVLDLSELAAYEPSATLSLAQNGSDAVVVATLDDGSTVDLVTMNNVDVSSWDDANWIL